MIQHGTRRQSGGPPPREEIRLPDPQPVKYFVDENGVNARLDPDLLDKTAEEWAKKFDQLSASQLRRFYEHVLGLQRQLELESRDGDREASFDRLRADFKMLKAKAAYAYKRQGAKIPRDFLQFVVNHVKAVNTARDFEAFAKHFQAVVAFHKFYEKEK